MQIFCSKLISQFHSLISIFIIHDSSTPCLKHGAVGGGRGRGTGEQVRSVGSAAVLPLLLTQRYTPRNRRHVSAFLLGWPKLRTRGKQVFHRLKNPGTSLPGKLQSKWDLVEENEHRLGQDCMDAVAPLVKTHCVAVKNLVREKNLRNVISWIESFFFFLRVFEGDTLCFRHKPGPQRSGPRTVSR